MRIYNTLTKTKEELIPMKEGEYRIYACGPTVYNYIHIGNARPICIFDTLRRYLEYRGNKVTFVQNFTDVDDKIINKAATEGVTAGEIAEKYIAESEVFKDQIMGCELPGIVFLWNAVSPECRALLPMIEAFEEKNKGKVKVTKVDIYKSKGLADRLGVEAVPAVVCVKGGKIDHILVCDITAERVDALL